MSINNLRGQDNNKKTNSIIANELFESFCERPENKHKSKDILISEFIKKHNLNTSNGLIEQFGGNKISFDQIKETRIRLTDLIGEDTMKYSGTINKILTQNLTTRQKIPEIIDNLTKKIEKNLSSEQKKGFEDSVIKTQSTSLNEFISKLKNFLNSNKTVNVDTIGISLTEIKDILALPQLENEFNTRPKNIKNTFDLLYTSQEINALKKIYENLKATTKQTIKAMNISLNIKEILKSKDPKTIKIINKLRQNKRDFSKLEEKEVQDLIDQAIDQKVKTTNSTTLGIDKQTYENLLKNTYSLDEGNIEYKLPNQEIINIKTEKRIIGGENENFEKGNHDIPLEIKIDLNDTKTQQLLENSQNGLLYDSLYSVETNNGTQNIGEGYLVKIGEKSGFISAKINGDINKNEQPELFDEKGNIRGDNLFLYDKNNNFIKDKNGKIISILPENKYDIKILDKKISLNNEQLNRLIQMQTVISNIPDEQLPKEGDKKTVENIKENMNNKTEHQENNEESFQEYLRNDIKGNPNRKREKGAKLRFASDLKSPLPPNIGEDKQRVQIEITNPNKGKNEFEFKMFGSEQKLGSLEGQTFTGQKTKQYLDNFGNGLLYKTLDTPNDFNKTLENLKNSKISGLDTSNLENFIDWNGNNFVFNGGENKGQKVESFATEDIYGFDDAKGEKRQNINYKIKHNNNGTFTISTKFMSEDHDDKNGKSEISKEHSFTTDYNGFILFVNQKKLLPKGKKETEIAEQDFQDKKVKSFSKKLKWKWFSIAALSGGIKGITKAIEEKIKAQQSDQVNDMKERLVEDFGVYKKLGKVAGRIPGMSDIFGGLQYEHYKDRDTKVWKKIEGNLTAFEADNDFGETFGNEYKKIITGEKKAKDRFEIAALLLANINKGGGPYSRLPEYRFKGQWVKLLLGEEHHKRFMAHLKEQEQRCKNMVNVDKKAEENELVRSEMTYLVNVIGSRAHGQKFGSVPGDDSAKKLLSDKFAGELESRVNGWISKGAIETRFGDLKNITNFNLCYTEYRRYLASGRSQHALAFLKKTATLAKTEKQRSILKMAISYGMMSGFFRHYADKSTKGMIESMCRTIGFAPGLLIHDSSQQAKLEKAFNIMTKGEFSKKTGFSFQDFGIDGDHNYGKFINKFEAFRQDQGYGDTISNFLKSLPLSELDENGKPLDPSIKELRDITVEEGFEDLDRDITQNRDLIADSPLSQTKTIVSREMLNYTNGTFSGQESNEIEVKNKFRKGYAKEVKNLDDKRLIRAMKIFLNRFEDKGFDEGNFKSIINRLATVKKLKEQGKSKDAQTLLWYTFAGQSFLSCGRGYPPSTFKAAVETLTDSIWKNIDNMGSLVGDIFGQQFKGEFNNNLIFIPRNKYNDIMNQSDFMFDNDNEYGLYDNDDDQEVDTSKDIDRDNLKLDKKTIRRIKPIIRSRGDTIINNKIIEMEKNLERRGISHSHSISGSRTDNPVADTKEALWRSLSMGA